MTRELHGHKSSEKDPLRILVIDQPGSGNANHAYLITGMAGLMDNASTDMTMSYLEGEEIPRDETIGILFQQGPIPDHGINGVTIESLMEICIDRLNGFQAGPFACDENQRALDHLKASQQVLLERTRARVARGVEGKEVK